MLERISKMCGSIAFKCRAHCHSFQLELSYFDISFRMGNRKNPTVAIINFCEQVHHFGTDVRLLSNEHRTDSVMFGRRDVNTLSVNRIFIRYIVTSSIRDG